MKQACAALLALLWAGALLISHAENWPQWRGPLLNGSTTEQHLPGTIKLPDQQVWKADLPGDGASSPIVWGERIFLTVVDEATNNINALCLSAKDGNISWQVSLGPAKKLASGNTMASPSPVTDGTHVYFFAGNGTFTATDMQGKVIWTRNLMDDYGAFVIKFGYSCSPLLYKDTLYLPVLQNKNPKEYDRKATRTEELTSFLLAIDPADGKTKWQQTRKTDATGESTEAYNTPIPYEDAQGAVIVLVGGECVTGHDPATGAEVWRWWFTPNDRQIWQRVVTSAVTGPGMIYVVRPKHRPVYALTMAGKTGVLGEETLAWEYAEQTPDVITPLLYQDHLYVLEDDNRILVCLNPKTGEVIYEQKLTVKGPFRASPTGADGKLYLISEGGDLLILRAGETYEEVGRMALGENPCHTPVVAANERLYIRTAKSLYSVRSE